MKLLAELPACPGAIDTNTISIACERDWGLPEPTSSSATPRSVALGTKVYVPTSMARYHSTIVVLSVAWSRYVVFFETCISIAYFASADKKNVSLNVINKSFNFASHRTPRTPVEKILHWQIIVIRLQISVTPYTFLVFSLFLYNIKIGYGCIGYNFRKQNNKY